VDEDLWDAYDRMGPSFRQHAADSAYNAHYDRPAVLAALGPVTGRQVPDAACGPGLYLHELVERGAEVTAFDASPVMVCPVDDLQYVGSGDVIGVGPALGRDCPAAMQVDAEPRIAVLPAAAALVDLDHQRRPLRLSHVSDCSEPT
jgi:SAM-dependent methyltransferase